MPETRPSAATPAAWREHLDFGSVAKQSVQDPKERPRAVRRAGATGKGVMPIPADAQTRRVVLRALVPGAARIGRTRAAMWRHERMEAR